MEITFWFVLYMKSDNKVISMTKQTKDYWAMEVL